MEYLGESSTPEIHFVCVQSVYIDKENSLWILDPANLGESVVTGGAKLLKVDLHSDSIMRVFYFDKDISHPETAR